jgi:hypothetical protein
MLAGEPPFTGPTPQAVLARHMLEPPRSLRVIRPDIPESIERIIGKALAKSPADRFQTADEFRSALDGAAGVPSGSPRLEQIVKPLVTVPTPTVVLPTPGAKPSGASTARRTAARTKRRRPWLARPALAIVGVATGMLLVFTVWGPGWARFQSVYSAVPRLSDAADSSPAPTSYHVRALIGSGENQREVKCRMILGTSTIRVEGDKRLTLHEVPYEHIRSISYSHGFDPLWTGPNGPSRVVRVSGGTLGTFGIFVARDWVSLRTTNPDAEFVVLRFEDEPQARRAVGALEKRTRLKSDVVGGR